MRCSRDGESGWEFLIKPELIIIDSLEEAQKLQDYLSDKDFITFDTETTGLSKRDKVIGFSICAEESKAFYVITDKVDSAPLISTLVKKNLIMHNGVFDCMMIESNYKIRLIESLHTDTMILAHLLNENRRVGLKELALEYFGEDSTAEQKEMEASIVANGGLITKDRYELYKADPYIIGKYGAKDAWLTYKLFYELVPELYEQKLDQFFYEDESMPLLRGPTYDLNTTGLQVDTKALLQLKKTLEAECEEAKAFIHQEIHDKVKDKYPGTNAKNTFNIDSPQQLSWLLFGKYLLEFGTLTAAGKEVCKSLGLKLPYTARAKRDFIEICSQQVGLSYVPGGKVNGKEVKPKLIKEPWGYIACDKSVLDKLAPKYEWIKKLLEYKKKQKLLNTYVEGIEERIQYGIIQPGFLQHGTTSGRYSSRNPNFQNLPRDDKRVKSCIIARPDKVFVGADYSQLEPRVFAYYSRDERLLEAFKGEDDFYSVIGMNVYGKTDCIPRKDGSPDAFGIKYKRLRDLSKNISLAVTYGATAKRLAPITGKSVEDTQQDIDNYFETFPGVLNMMLEAHKLAKTQGFVTNIFGRLRRMPEALKIEKLYGSIAHGELPYEARNVLNLAVNHRIQSTGASIVNRAMIKFYRDIKELNLNCKIVLQVHDSIVAECEEKDKEIVKLLLQNAMESATVLEGINLEAIPKIGETLAEV